MCLLSGFHAILLLHGLELGLVPCLMFRVACLSPPRQLDQLIVHVDILQSLFERAGGAKEVGKRCSLSRKRRSRTGVGLPTISQIESELCFVGCSNFETP